MGSNEEIALIEKVLASKAEDRKQAGMLKLKLALEMAKEELDVIEALSVIRADIWDDWMGEVIVDMASHGVSAMVIKSVEELQYRLRQINIEIAFCENLEQKS